VKKLIVSHTTGETVLHKAARLGYEVHLDMMTSVAWLLIKI